MNIYLKCSKFDDLPLDYKKGLIIWMMDGEKVEWSIDTEITDWVSDKNVDILIADYSRAFGHEIWSYGLVPTQVIIDRISKGIEEEGDYNSFNEWYIDYQASNYSYKGADFVPTNHGDSILPIITDYDLPTLIDDGWHRFSYYISRGHKQIPVLNIND